MKFLLWAVVALVVVLWLTSGKRGSGATHVASAQAGKDGEAMRQCAYCGTYIPVSEAVLSKPDKAYCSEEHRLRDARS